MIVTSLVELSAGELAFCAAALLVASYICGYSGFGFSTALVAGATFVIEPVAAVPPALTFKVLASLAQGPSIWREIRWPDFRLLLAAAIVGNPIGLVILTTVDSDVLRGPSPNCSSTTRPEFTPHHCWSSVSGSSQVS